MIKVHNLHKSFGEIQVLNGIDEHIEKGEVVVVIGPSGSGDFDISQAKKPTMKIVPVFHGKTGGGYLTQFYPPTGDVTYLGITQDKNGVFKFVVAEGVNEEGEIFTFGDTNMRTKFSIPCREFCNKWSEAGPTHHMAAAATRKRIRDHGNRRL